MWGHSKDTFLFKLDKLIIIWYDSFNKYKFTEQGVACLLPSHHWDHKCNFQEHEMFKTAHLLILEEKRACMSSIFKIVDKLHVQHNFFLFIIKKSFFPFIKNYFSNISNWYKFFIVIDHNPFFFLKWHVLLARRFLALSVQHDYIFGSCWHDTPFWPSQKSQPEHEYFMFSGYPIKLESNKNKK